jgi:hypothetical protein
MLTRRTEPTGVPSGAFSRMRLPSRMKMGAFETSLMVMLETAMSSICAPSTLSIARPRERSNTALEIVMFLKSPPLSVPILMRPVGPSRSGACVRVRLYVPSSSEPMS